MKAATERICRDLGLPRGDRYTQDWAYELPDEFRSPAWLRRYKDAYHDPAYRDAERLLLVQLMFDVVNDLFDGDNGIGRLAWSTLEEVIRASPELHRNQLAYWTMPESSLDDAWAITPMARALWDKLFG